MFATGGIGGVHREPSFDIPADLSLLACTPVKVVCAGAKTILNLEATLEYLETQSVPVIGYQTNEFPGFYTRSSGLRTSCRADTPAQVAAIASAHWRMGFQSAVLVTVPPPEASASENQTIETAILCAFQDAEREQLHGQAVTPFLVQRVNQYSNGESLEINLDLLKNNARVAAEIAPFIYQPDS